MNLKNYTSETPVSSSIIKIEKCLVEAGATDISKKYDDGICSSITFRLMVKGHPVFFMLPANINACFKVMWAEVKRPRKDTEKNTRYQAERTAWRIVSDWVECQLSMIRLEQAEALQVFLPYVYNPETEQTFYQKIASGNLKLLN